MSDMEACQVLADVVRLYKHIHSRLLFDQGVELRLRSRYVGS